MMEKIVTCGLCLQTPNRALGAVLASEFDQAMSHFGDQLRETRQAGWRQWFGAQAKLLCATARCLRELLSLPRLTVVLPVTTVGHEIAASARQRIYRVVPNVFTAGVLELSIGDPSAYLVGRGRQAVRTNITKAKKAGMRCRRLTWFEAEDAVEAVLQPIPKHAHYRAWLSGRVHDKQGEFWAVHGADEKVRALLVVTTAGEVAFLNWLLSVEAGDRSAARYLLSAEVFQDLATRGVRRVLTGSALGMSPGLVYFQRRLGFEARNLRIRFSS